MLDARFEAVRPTGYRWTIGGLATTLRCFQCVDERTEQSYGQFVTKSTFMSPISEAAGTPKIGEVKVLV